MKKVMVFLFIPVLFIFSLFSQPGSGNGFSVKRNLVYNVEASLRIFSTFTLREARRCLVE
jgi:hypothetical protein